MLSEFLFGRLFKYDILMTACTGMSRLLFITYSSILDATRLTPTSYPNTVRAHSQCPILLHYELPSPTAGVPARNLS